MGNKTVGKKHNRQANLTKIQSIDLAHFPKYFEDPVEFFQTRLEFRETLETWGYFWAHKLIEDAFVRPNFDLSLFNKISKVNCDDLDFSFDSLTEKEENIESDNPNPLHIQVNQLKEEMGKKQGASFLKNTLGSGFMVTRKLTRHIHVIGIAVTLVEVMLEFESEEKVDAEIDSRIDKAKDDLNDNILKTKLTDLKAKFLAMKNTFELVVNGTDDYDIRRSRLDSVLGIWEEIALMVIDQKSEIYQSAHLCLDLVFLFWIMHLTMLEMGISTFKMKDYDADYDQKKQFYDLLVQSYVEKAISNYIKPLVLNYHNQYSSFKETEEIFYERSSTVINKAENNKFHSCWTEDVEELEKDNMFYNFKTDKLNLINPPFLVDGTESPLLCRALRYGMWLKLEEMLAQYSEVKTIFNQSELDQELREINEGLDFEIEDKENIPAEESKHTQEYVKRDSYSVIDHSAEFDQKYNLIKPKDPHLLTVKKMQMNKFSWNETKKKAGKEQQMLIEFYSANVEEIENKDNGVDKFFFQTHLHELLTDNQEIFENLSKHVIFSEENRRFFDVKI